MLMEPVRRFVDSDNSCLFSSIGYLVDSKNFSESTKYQYRQLLVNYLEDDNIEEEMLDLPKEDYIENIQNPATWGGAIELKLFSDMLQTEIASIDVQSNRVDIFGQDKNYPQRMYVLYNGVHYDPLVMAHTEDSKDDITNFASDDNETLISLQSYVKNFKDFIEIEKIGKSLSSLHLNFLDVNKHSINIKFSNRSNIKDKDLYKVEKMKHPILNGKKDKSKIIYNSYITLENIPLEAYDYIVNEKSAIHWVMDQQSLSFNDETNIIDDPNDYSINTVKNFNYQIELIQKVITVSLETQKLIKSLPALKIAHK